VDGIGAHLLARAERIGRIGALGVAAAEAEHPAAEIDVARRRPGVEAALLEGENVDHVGGFCAARATRLRRRFMGGSSFAGIKKPRPRGAAGRFAWESRAAVPAPQGGAELRRRRISSANM